MILSRPVTPRATRTADIAASVPDETNRTFSIEGTACGHDLGDLDLAHRRRAEARAEVEGLDDRRADAGMGMPQDHRPPRADVVDVFVAVDVMKIRPFGPGHERGLAADRPERPRRAVHPAGDHAVGPDEGLVAPGELELGFAEGRGLHAHDVARGRNSGS